MFATMARQGVLVQLELSGMRLALNMAKMAIGGFSHSAIEKTQYLIKKRRAEVREERMQWVEFLGHTNVKAAMERHPAMPWDHQTDGCLPCQNFTVQSVETRWRRKGMRAPPPEQLRQPTPEPMPHPDGMPPVPPGADEGALTTKIEGVPPGYVYIYCLLPGAQCFQSYCICQGLHGR